jgi:hypothetical protein
VQANPHQHSVLLETCQGPELAIDRLTQKTLTFRTLQNHICAKKTQGYHYPFQPPAPMARRRAEAIMGVFGEALMSYLISVLRPLNSGYHETSELRSVTSDYCADLLSPTSVSQEPNPRQIPISTQAESNLILKWKGFVTHQVSFNLAFCGVTQLTNCATGSQKPCKPFAYLKDIWKPSSY